MERNSSNRELHRHTVDCNPLRWRVLLLALITAGFGQGHDRLTADINSNRLVTLFGSRNPQVEELSDEGALAPSERIRGLSFRFRPTAEQAAALDQLLADHQNPSSPHYQQWLTPEEFGDRFGLAQNDLARVTSWLESQGFQVEATARSRTSITFSGTAAHISRTFKTELHRFHVDGRAHFANVSEAQIPADLGPLVYIARGLDNLPLGSRARVGRMLNNPEGGHSLGPGDLATIYNVSPLLQNGYDGTGQKIVVAGASSLNMSDIQRYRDQLGLPKNDPKVLLVPGYPEPGRTDEFYEATTDVQIAGAAAPRASIIYVYAPNAYAAVDYAIDQNLAPIINFSFGSCEKSAAAKLDIVAATRAMAQQAVAQGITWLASSGDTGPAACEQQLRDFSGRSGITVNLPTAFPEVTGVGGTAFAEGNGTYWAGGYTKGAPTALSYIPEVAWNDTTDGDGLAASGGGASMFYVRPSWQTGTGVPNVNVRLVPDLSFAASWGHNPYAILVDGEWRGWGGTSAATPFFAGTLAILNQYLLSAGVATRSGLGNINPKLYQLAQTAPGVFHDITTGNNIIPCQTGTPDCTIGHYGYSAGPGWDPVTGLGSLDVTAFVLNWAGGSTTVPGGTSSVNVSVEPSPVYKQATDADGYSWFYTLTLEETAGVPTTITSFTINGSDLSQYIPEMYGRTNLPARGRLSAQLRAQLETVPSDYVFAFGGVDPGGQRWNRQITVSFRGEQGSAAISLTSFPSNVRPSPQGASPCPADYPFYQQVHLQELNGLGVRLSRFVADGEDLSDSIESWFGSRRLAPNGTLQADFCWQADQLPATKTLSVEGVDASGHIVKASVAVTFKSAALIPSTFTVSKDQLQLSAASGGQATASLNVTLRADETWGVSIIPVNRKPGWLTITSRTSGRGPAQVNLVASAAGLPNGVYTAILIFQSENSTPQLISVPVVLLVGASSGASITGAQNAASFQRAFAPGMLMTLYGTGLAKATEAAKSLPLPLTLGGVTASINGIPAPLWFVSPGQINLQIPYEIPLGDALVVVNNNGAVSSYTIHVTPTAPGIFTNSGAVVPVATANRGAGVLLFITGEGDTTPMVETGAPPPAGTPVAQLPKPLAPLKVTVGGIPAEVTFAGNPFLVGIAQINFIVPANAPAGAQPVVVTIGGASSAAAMLTVQ